MIIAATILVLQVPFFVSLLREPVGAGRAHVGDRRPHQSASLQAVVRV